MGQLIAFGGNEGAFGPSRPVSVTGMNRSRRSITSQLAVALLPAAARQQRFPQYRGEEPSQSTRETAHVPNSPAGLCPRRQPVAEQTGLTVLNEGCRWRYSVPTRAVTSI